MIPTPPEAARDHAATARLELDLPLEPADLLDRLGEGSLFLLESAGDLAGGRWSILGGRPTARFVSRSGENRFEWLQRERTHAWTEEPLVALRRALAAFPSLPADPDLPFTGGAVGLFSYELGRRLLPIQARATNDLDLPEISLYFHEQVLLFDHHRDRIHALVTARGSSEEAAQESAAAELEGFVESIRCALVEPAPGPGEHPQNPDADPLPLNATLDAEAYRRAVSICREEILAGEAYELCLTGRFEALYDGDPVALYRSLRRENPAPYASFFRHPEGLLLGSSPERFLRLAPDGRVEARPIKGTRPRGRDEVEDRSLREELAASPKDRAENVMIVDLLRNDLHRVCTPGSVEVGELCAVETHPGVFQMVSTIEGELRAGLDRCDLLAATFPGGSMTGAPKIAAMNILETLEPTVRGWYSGCQGYLGFDGGMDLSIVIRGIQLLGKRALVGAGGAVVYDSDPEAEWQEALHKAAAPLRALALAAGKLAPEWVGTKKEGPDGPPQILQRHS
jgi:para-aminobenzoate synthetase component I